MRVAVGSSAVAESAQLTASEVMRRMIETTGATPPANTVDTLKAGDPNSVVTGIATTFMDTYAMLEKALSEAARTWSLPTSRRSTTTSMMVPTKFPDHPDQDSIRPPQMPRVMKAPDHQVMHPNIGELLLLDRGHRPAASGPARTRWKVTWLAVVTR